MTVGIDTNIVIYAFRESPDVTAEGGSAADDGQRERADRLLDSLDETQTTIAFSIVSVAEFLVPIPSDRHRIISNALAGEFEKVPFGLAEAMRTAGTYSVAQDEAVRSADHGVRRQIRPGAMIIAPLARPRGRPLLHPRSPLPSARQIRRFAGL